MTHLRTSRWAVVFFLCLCGCATSSSYRVLFQDDSAAELSVSSDRLLLECEYLSDADEKGFYAFYIHALDQENTATTFFQTNKLDKDGCENQTKAVEMVLKGGKRVYIAGLGDIKDTDVNKDLEYYFPGRGKIRSNGRSLSFVAISNENGLCFDAYGGFNEMPCPSEPFPLWSR